MKKVLIAGATGMVGSLVLKNCLSSSEIAQVTILVRRNTNQNHPKLKEVVINDFKNYSEQKALFQDIDIGFFCIGVYTGQVSDEKFAEITIDYAIAFAEALKKNSPEATLCFLSGAGADRTEKSKMSFAKYKGIAENSISALGFKAFYTFRPGYIYPVEPRQEPNLMYRVSRTLYPLIRLMGKNNSIKSTELAKAMFKIGLNGAKQEILENKDILEYA